MYSVSMCINVTDLEIYYILLQNLAPMHSHVLCHAMVSRRANDAKIIRNSIYICDVVNKRLAVSCIEKLIQSQSMLTATVHKLAPSGRKQGQSTNLVDNCFIQQCINSQRSKLPNL
ncbi:hypothetical protein CHS0354_017940, partial [Potamilus streckersoni]